MTKIFAAIALLRENPQLGLSILLFIVGVGSLCANIPILAGALFGAGASLLGAWVTELNNRLSLAEDKARREANARRYLAPELNRIIERVLNIHSRAIPNFTAASVGNDIKPNDLREDFIPYMPVLYPNAPQFRELSGDDATALITFYDSLHALEKFVNDWWAREGQLPVNIFNMIMKLATDSLVLADACIARFELEKLFPPQYESWDTLSSRIERSKVISAQSLKSHIERFEAKSRSN